MILIGQSKPPKTSVTLLLLQHHHIQFSLSRQWLPWTVGLLFEFCHVTFGQASGRTLLLTLIPSSLPSSFRATSLFVLPRTYSTPTYHPDWVIITPHTKHLHQNNYSSSSEQRWEPKDARRSWWKRSHIFSGERWNPRARIMVNAYLHSAFPM